MGCPKDSRYIFGVSFHPSRVKFLSAPRAAATGVYPNLAGQNQPSNKSELSVSSGIHHVGPLRIVKRPPVYCRHRRRGQYSPNPVAKQRQLLTPLGGSKGLCYWPPPRWYWARYTPAKRVQELLGCRYKDRGGQNRGGIRRIHTAKGYWYSANQPACRFLSVCTLG